MNKELWNFIVKNPSCIMIFASGIATCLSGGFGACYFIMCQRLNLNKDALPKAKQLEKDIAQLQEKYDILLNEYQCLKESIAENDKYWLFVSQNQGENPDIDEALVKFTKSE